MDIQGIYMDKTRAFLEKLICWVNNEPLVKIPFVGHAGYGFANSPRPFIEICYLQQGHYEKIKLGDLIGRLPSNYASIHSVHHGNYSEKDKPAKSWCLFLDVSEAKEFKYLYKTPVFNALSISNPNRLIEKFKKLTICSKRAHWSSTIYSSKVEMDIIKYDKVLFFEKLMIKTALLDLLFTLYEEIQHSTAGAATSIPKSIYDVMEFIETNYANPEISIETLAKISHLTAGHFTRIFKKHIGESPMYYLRRKRIAQSMVLLRETELQIQNICDSVGFKDPFHFSRVFNEFEKMSPRKYRNLTKSINT